MKAFIGCSDEIESVVGDGYYRTNDSLLHIFTTNNSIGEIFEKRQQDAVKVKRLTFKKESGETIFAGPFMVIDIDKSLNGEWNIELKESITTIKR